MTPQELVDELYDAVDNDDMCNRSYLVYEVEDLCAENAKLRRLVKECHELLQDLLRGVRLDPLTVEVMEQRMREMGVEV